MKMYSVSELENLEDYELLQCLKTSWGVGENEPIEVFGELIRIKTLAGKYHHRLYQLKLLKNNTIKVDYPIEKLVGNETIMAGGIYVPLSFDNSIKKHLTLYSKILIICNLELSNKLERKKHKNPLLVNVVSPTIQVYTNIDESFIVKDRDNLLVKESIINTIKFEYQKEFDELSKTLEKELINKQEILNSNLKEVTQKYQFEEERLALLISTKQKELDDLHENLESLMITIEEKNRTKDILTTTIEELLIQIEKAEETMAQKLEKLRAFIKTKADTLLQLEFIDKEEYNTVLMIKEQISLENENFLSFGADLQGDKQKAISHIQAYLYNKDIIYPRFILEDFFALIQTNDLIILAGESGSGKTNLVKSFADAIGGKSFIIPVKPNWTSAEDLVGYYNPLEKKYLATPFLEALIEAQNNPTVPYFICLDEMNLARVEYYFADFLSLLEERGDAPEIKLYSEDESAHILSELKNVVELIQATKEKYQKNNIINFVKLLQDEEINKELTRVFGFSDKDSLIKYHTDLRRMINGILNIPSSIIFPKNVRIIGAINIDETTHYLSPKILDRAHIMKFDSPLLFDWAKIAEEIEEVENKDFKIKFLPEDFGERKPYPSFEKDDEFCKTIVDFTKKYFSPLGVEVGLRTIRQGLNYEKIFLEQGSDERLVMNNFILHKILPKLTFDGSKKIIIDNVEKEKNQLLSDFMNDLKKYIDVKLIQYESNNSIIELEHLIKNANNNNGIVNYWA